MSPLEKRLTALGNALHNASVEAHKLAALVADKEHDSAALQRYFLSVGEMAGAPEPYASAQGGGRG